MSSKVKRSFIVEKVLDPCIGFDIEIEYPKSKLAIINVEGRLKTTDDAILGSLNEIPDESLSDSFEVDNSQNLVASDSVADKLFANDLYHLQMYSSLNEKALKQIEDFRASNPYKAIEFKIELVVEYLKSNIRVAHFLYVPTPNSFLEEVRPNPPFIPDDRNIEMIMSTPRSNFNSAMDAGWVLSGKGSPNILGVGKVKLELPYQIDVGTWVNEFSTRLGLRSRVLLELPSGGELFDKVKVYLHSAEIALSTWDTKSVFANCREIGSALDRHVKRTCGEKSFTFKERWGRAYRQFSHWASLDLHIEDLKIKKEYEIEELSVFKPDAECLLFQTKNLIKFAQELTQDV